MSESTPLVSIVVPMRDAASTLDGALRSVLRQREARLECLVVDDGSRDDGPARVEALARRDRRVRLLRRPALGLVPALVSGVAAARAPFIARMDADDWMHRDRLALQLEAFRGRPRLGVVGCHVRLFPRSSLGAGMRRYEAWLNGLHDAAAVRRDAFVECPLAHPTWLARREVFAEHGYRQVDWPEDYDLLLRWLAAGVELGVVPRRLHGWRHGPGRLSQRSPLYRPDRFVACKASHLRRGFLEGHPRYLLWGYGGTGRALHAALARLGRRPAAILELHPGRLGQRIHGAPVSHPDELPGLPRLPLLVSVAHEGPRTEIRARLAGMGFIEGRDFLCAA